MRAAGRAAFLWPQEASELLKRKRSLTELPKIGPFLEKQIVDWLEHPPAEEAVPEIRRGFLTWTEAQTILAKKPDWKKSLKGDLQMHTEWSDGSATVREMALAG